MVEDNSYKYRNRYVIGIAIFFICLFLGILGIFIRYNYEGIKMLFKEKPIVLTEDEKNVSKSLVIMKKIEELAYEYDKDNYQNYMLQYLAFKDNINFGEGYQGFLLKVQNSENYDELRQLWSENKIHVTNLKENVDLNVVAETMCVFVECDVNPVFDIVGGNYSTRELKDVSAWMSPLLDLIQDYSNIFGESQIPEANISTVKAELLERFNGDVTGYNFEAAMDAYNIMEMVNNQEYGSTIYYNIKKYYEEVNHISRINNFKIKMFGDHTDIRTLEIEIRTRISEKIKENYQINQSVFDLCLETYAEYLIKCG